MLSIKGKVTAAALASLLSGGAVAGYFVADSFNGALDSVSGYMEALTVQGRERHEMELIEKAAQIKRDDDAARLVNRDKELDLMAKEARLANEISIERARAEHQLARDQQLAWVWTTSQGVLYGLVAVVPVMGGCLVLWRVIASKRAQDRATRQDSELVTVLAGGAVQIPRDFLMLNGDAAWSMVIAQAEHDARVRLAQAERVELPALTHWAPTHNPTTTYSPTTTNDKELVLMARQDEMTRQEEEMQGASDDERASIIFEALQMQGVPASVSLKARGPQVETYSIRPGHRASKGRVKRVTVREITKHEADIAMALSVPSLRMYQGAGYVACEVARSEREFVLTTDVMASAQWRDAMTEMALPLALGVDTLGRQIIVDLCPLPHFLIGGATNMGKSVVIQTLIYSLCQQPVSKVRLTLIDPKEVEFDPYRVVPHVANVIIEMDQAAQALQGALNEMDRRAQLFKSVKVQNISQYNKVADEPLAYIVIIIDELADLMATNGDEVEEVIVRLAQKARYAGIHLILATQRPDAETVTPLIRTNMPARMSVRCIAKGDSMVILGESGAEKLLDRGDALFMSGSVPLTRLQGAYIGANEAIKAILLAHGVNGGGSQEVPQEASQGVAQGPPIEVSGGSQSSLDYRDADPETRANYIKFLHKQGLTKTDILRRVWGTRGNSKTRKKRNEEIDAALASLALNGNGHHS